MTDRELVQHIIRVLIDNKDRFLCVYITQNSTKVALRDAETGDVLVMLPISRKMREEMSRPT